MTDTVTNIIFIVFFILMILTSILQTKSNNKLEKIKKEIYELETDIMQKTSRSPDLCSTLTASSQSGYFSDILRLAHNYSDGIVPDLHRVLFQSIAGTCSHDKNCQNMNLIIIL